jgi:PPM family protein phosphatase
MRIAFAAISDAGDQKENQDFHATKTFSDGSDGLFVIADGLGGHRGGAVASQIAVKAIMDHKHRGQPNWLEDAIQAANSAIAKKADEEIELSRMRTTIVALWIRNGEAFWANVGDSRLYVIRNHRIVEHTPDDTVAFVLFKTGEIGEDEIRGHPDRSKLLKTLGADDAVKVHLQAAGTRVKLGDRFLLCSDGLWECVRHDQIEDISRRNSVCADFVAALMSAAKRSATGEKDNITVVVAQPDVLPDNVVINSFRRAFDKFRELG